LIYIYIFQQLRVDVCILEGVHQDVGHWKLRAQPRCLIRSNSKQKYTAISNVETFHDVSSILK